MLRAARRVMALLCYAVCMLLPPEDFEPPPQPRRKRDSAETVKGDLTDKEAKELRSRRGSGARVPTASTAYQAGYDGIDIIDSTAGGRDRDD